MTRSPLRLILLGAPGAGKGTQAEIISEKYSIPTISTGAIIREAISAGTETGLSAKAYADRGELVPDEVVIAIIRERLASPDCDGGFILDGFPRTVPQAAALDDMGVQITRVVSIEVSDERIAARMGGRRVCGKCGASYHIEYNPPVSEGKCDKCGSELSVRRDDAPEVVLERLAVYHRQTEPLKKYYGDKGILRLVEGQEEVADTTALTLAALSQ